MSGWLAIGLVVIGLVAVAVIVLIFDLSRGDISGRHTMARARRLLVVATDDATSARAESWIDEQRGSRSDLQCFLLSKEEGEGLYQAIHEVLEREKPDAIVMIKHPETAHHHDTLARLREEGAAPIDVITLEEVAA